MAEEVAALVERLARDNGQRPHRARQARTAGRGCAQVVGVGQARFAARGAVWPGRLWVAGEPAELPTPLDRAMPSVRQDGWRVAPPKRCYASCRAAVGRPRVHRPWVAGFAGGDRVANEATGHPVGQSVT